MAGENEEVVRRVLRAITDRDLALLVELTDPEVEWWSFFSHLGGSGLYRGHEDLRRYVGDLTEAFEVLSPEVHDTLAVGEVVVAVGRVHYRGRESGVDSELRAGWMFRFRARRVLVFRAFRDPERVLEGLRPLERP